VVLLTDNAGTWLHRALASLLLQTHTKWLAVVVDDASDDNTTSHIAAAAAAADDRILHWHNSQRLGCLANTVAGNALKHTYHSLFSHAA
jgi:glycosyltransferase involved in cell wall biosynthesis